MLEELQRRNYPPATTRGYILAIKQFAEYFGKSPERLGGDEIRRFELYMLREKKLALGTVEGHVRASFSLQEGFEAAGYRLSSLPNRQRRVVAEKEKPRPGEWIT